MSAHHSSLLKNITMGDFLSYGPGPQVVGLEALNVIIGPNGSGKSNLVEALAVLRAVRGDLALPIRQGGGVNDWLWKGEAEATSAVIEVVFGEGVVATRASHSPGVRFRIEFGSERNRFVVLDERIENETPDRGRVKPYFYFGYERGAPMINVAGEERKLNRADIDQTQSILSQRRDPDAYPEVTRVGDLLARILIYRSWHFGPNAPIRMPCRADVPTDVLLEDFSNLPARLLAISRDPSTKKRLIDLIGQLAPGYSDYTVALEGGVLQLYLTEYGRSVSSQRLSDGTMRYICLLAMLLDPGAASLLVIEEPELGLHPDMLPTLRDLMVEASERVQLVVTTHSTQLVDAMTEQADSVLICEKEASTTHLRRLEQAEVDQWREFGSLGNLWMQGHLGGTRW